MSETVGSLIVGGDGNLLSGYYGYVDDLYIYEGSITKATATARYLMSPTSSPTTHIPTQGNSHLYTILTLDSLSLYITISEPHIHSYFTA